LSYARTSRRGRAVLGLCLLAVLGGCIASGEVTFPEERENPPGSVEVSVSTTGANPDPDGYDLTIDESMSQSVPTNGTVTFSPLSAGSYQVTISGVDGSCMVPAGPSQSFTVLSGSTSNVAFSVSCP
jgi:hypothetical protein